MSDIKVVTSNGSHEAAAPRDPGPMQIGPDFFYIGYAFAPELEFVVQVLAR